MNTSQQQPRINRLRQEDLKQTVGNLAKPPTASSSYLGTTTQVQTYPTSAGAYYGLNPTTVSGDAYEGGPATYSTDSSKLLYAYNVGSSVPPSGTRVLVHQVGGRATFRYDGNSS
jgi:hypothetical protein